MVHPCTVRPMRFFASPNRSVIISLVMVFTFAAVVCAVRRAGLFPGAKSDGTLLAPKSGAAAGASDPLDALRNPVQIEESAGSAAQQPERRAALQALARTSPEQATKWVLTQSAPERLVDATTVLVALSERPDDLVRCAETFCREDAQYIREHGNSLLAVLSATGDFERAVAFASRGGPERNEWLSRAFAEWADVAPSAAAKAALAFDGDDAVAVVFAAWAAKNRAAAETAIAQAADPTAVQRSALAALATSSEGS